MKITTANNNLATTPFPTNSITTVKRNGMIIGAQKSELTPLKVVFDSEDGKYLAGDTVYVRGDLAYQEFQIQTIDGQQCVIMPTHNVLVQIRA